MWPHMSYVQLLLITAIAACTAIYILAPWHRADDRCAATYPYALDCARGQVMGEYILE